ncbi:MAG: hypothetical protein GDA42_00055 [Ekhidna sp.]|nr:hypothetical protein [Ekhidna sp.]
MKTYLKCIIIFCLVCIAFSCNETEVLPDVQSEDAITVQKVLQKDEERNALYASAARNLASGLEDLNVRSFVRERVNEQFDGDYDFLVETSKYEQLPASPGSRTESLTFGDVLFQSEPSASGRTAGDLLSMIGKLHPLMQVALPQLEAGDAESWNIANEVPLVAFLPSDYDESNENATITAYDFEGNQYELSGREEPDRLVIVISDNERLIALKKPESDPNGRSESSYSRYRGCPIELPAYHENEEYRYYFREDIYEHCDTSPSSPTNVPSSPSSRSGSRPSSTPACDRERKNNKKDFINKAHFKDYSTLREFEHWTAGKPEVRLFVSYAINSANSGYTFSEISYGMGEKDWYKRKWFKEYHLTKNFDYEIIRWDPKVHGNKMYYTWIEEDPSLIDITVKVNVNSTFNFHNQNIANVNASIIAEISIGKKDDVIVKGFPIDFCDNTDGEGTLYKTAMYFWVNQQYKQQ